MKKILSEILYSIGFTKLLFLITLKLTKIRVINYHCTAQKFNKNFDAQLQLYSKYFANVTEADLFDYFETRVWKKNKPGLIITFDDGLRSNFDFAKPFLEKYQFTGWFFIPVNFIECNTRQFAEYNSINIKQEYDDLRFSMNKNELIELSKNHVIGVHTATHHRMKETDTNDVLNYEIVKSKSVLEDMLGIKINSFCWVGGELDHYTKRAHKLIKSNYYFSFLTNNFPICNNTKRHVINRTNIESNDSIETIIFQLSGLMDFFYTKKRIKLRSKFK